jgi:hypothetical protein
MQEDEVSYAADGLLLLEGTPLGFKFAPGAVTTWAGFAYGVANWVFNIVSAMGSKIELDALLIPLITLDQTLFDIYADMSGLHTVIAGLVLVLSLVGIYGAIRIGHHFAGWPGALLAGGLAAVTPLFCWFGVQSRPYSPAWSLTILSISVMLTCSGSRRWVWAGMIFGLAVASRIEMLFTVPLILWLMWVMSDNQDPVRSGVRMAATAILTFLVSAPWFISHLVGNVRKMITVRVFGEGAQEASLIVTFMMNEGLGIVAIVTLVGILFRCRTDRWKAWVALAYVLFLATELLTSKTSGGLRHVGYVFVIIVVLSGYALRGIQQGSGRRWATPLSVVVALLALSLPFARGLSMALEVRSGWVEHDAVGWVESNVPSGSPVFLVRAHSKVPLPTKASADRLWGEAAHQTAWSEKLERRLGDVGVELDYLPRGLSMEHMYQELSGLRRYFILGGGSEQSRPRYDVRLVRNDVGADDFQDSLDEFRRDGGVFWHSGHPLLELGPPSQAWVASDGTGVFLYTRPENSSADRIVN